MIQAVRRRVNHPLAICDGDASPAADERHEVRRLARPGRAFALLLHGLAVQQILVQHLELFRRVARAHVRFTAIGDEPVVLRQRFFHLHRVVRHQLGGGVDRRQAAADHDRRQPRLQVRQRVALEGAGELQRHQEVARLPNTPNQVVLHVDDRRLARAGRDRHVIEAVAPGVLDRQRAAEPDAAVHPDAAPARQRQVQQREEVLVPPHGDAVLRDAAEPLEHAFVELAVDFRPLADRPRAVGADAGDVVRQRLDLQPVDADHAEAVVHQIVRERVARRAEAHDEDVLAVVGQRVRPADVERVPSRQQTVDFDAPRHVQHVGEHAGFDLRDVDRLLLLIDAGLHAVVADAMTGARTHRVVDDDERQGAEGVAGLAQRVHLRDFLVERTAVEADAERVDADRAGLVVQSLRARVLVAVVAQDAVVNLAERLARLHARVGQTKAVAPPQAPLRPDHRLRHIRLRSRDIDQVKVVERLGKPEDHPAAKRLVVDAGGAPALQRIHVGIGDL